MRWNKDLTSDFYCTECGKKQETSGNTNTTKPDTPVIPEQPKPTCTHTNTETITTPATCGAAGSTVVKCKDCGKTISETPISATGNHTPGTPVVTNPLKLTSVKFLQLKKAYESIYFTFSGITIDIISSRL